MKKQLLEIDINRLNDSELSALSTIFYRLNEMGKVRAVQEAIAYVNGWMSDSYEKQYEEKYRIGIE